MKIDCLASSSAGNCYMIQNEHTRLMVECGLPMKPIRTRLLHLSPPVLFSTIDACLVTHQHGDHARSIQEMSTYCPIIASQDTLKACKVHGSKWPMKEWEIAHVKSFIVQPFAVDHDCEGAYGFIILDKETGESVLFINDTKLVKYDFFKYQFDYIMIECNHNDELLDTGDYRIVRTAQSHTSLETTLLTLSKMDMTKVKMIYLMHMSDGNSDQERCVREVKMLTGRPTTACLKDGGVSE